MDEISSAGRATFGGLATGLDTGAIVEALMELERRPLQLIENQRSRLDAQQTALQTLNTRVLALRDAAREIDNRINGLDAASASEEFLAFQASSSQESVLEVEAGSGALPGSFSVRVESLASVARRVSNAYATEDTAVTAGSTSFSVAYGQGQSIDLTLAGGTTLAQLRDAINTDPNNDGTVSAQILFDGTGHRLVVSGQEAGSANDVTVTTGISGFLDVAAGQDAADAVLSYLGVTVTRASNEISDLIPGVSLVLRGANDPDDPLDAVEVNVTRDDDAIAAKLQELVDAYNAVRDFSLDQTTLDAESNRGGALVSDPLVRSIERRAQSALGSVFGFADNPFSSLGQIGVAFDGQGRLSLDREALTTALDQDALAVRQLLSGDGVTDGAMTAVARTLEPVVQVGDGLIALREDGLEDRIEGLDRQIERFEDRLVGREEFLIRRFSALESLVSTLQSQAGFLGGLSR